MKNLTPEEMEKVFAELDGFRDRCKIWSRRSYTGHPFSVVGVTGMFVSLFIHSWPLYFASLIMTFTASGIFFFWINPNWRRELKAWHKKLDELMEPNPSPDGEMKQ
jgi:hypothetical protein